MSYNIGSFNVRNLNYATEKNSSGKPVRRVYGDIGRIITDHFDIAALQEVLSENVLRQLFPPFSGWEYRWMQSRSKTMDSREGYAFAWNARKFRLVSEPHLWVQYQQDPVLSAKGLLRHPYYARFTPSGTPNGGPFCEIRILNTHIRFAPKKANEGLSASDTELRKREFRVLTEQILNRVDERRYGDNMPAYTFLMGDYNLELPGNTKGPYLEEFVEVQDAGFRKTFVTVQHKPTTINGERNGFSHNYDHFTYNQTSFDERGIRTDCDALDTVKLYRSGDFEKHFLEISDHIPIMLTINLK